MQFTAGTEVKRCLVGGGSLQAQGEFCLLPPGDAVPAGDLSSVGIVDIQGVVDQPEPAPWVLSIPEHSIMTLSLRTFQQNAYSCLCDSVPWGLGHTRIHGACEETTRNRTETGNDTSCHSLKGQSQGQAGHGQFKAGIPHVSQTHLFPRDQRPHSRGARSPWQGEAGCRRSRLWALVETKRGGRKLEGLGQDGVAPPSSAGVQPQHFPRGLTSCQRTALAPLFLSSWPFRRAASFQGALSSQLNRLRGNESHWKVVTQ